MEKTIELKQITSFRGRYKFLSNFSHSPFVSHVYRDPEAVFKFPTVEHFFQACKAQTASNARKIVQAKTPRHAKTMGSWVVAWDDWNDIRNDVMLLGLRYKFTQSSRRVLLLATEEAELIEGNTWNDRYWGCSPVRDAQGNIEWVGENHLGKLLMQVRTELQEKQ